MRELPPYHQLLRRPPRRVYVWGRNAWRRLWIESFAIDQMLRRLTLERGEEGGTDPMNFVLLWDLLRMLFTAGAMMEALPPDGTVHSTDAGIPPAYATWRDGRRFEISLHIKRTK